MLVRARPLVTFALSAVLGLSLAACQVEAAPATRAAQGTSATPATGGTLPPAGAAASFTVYLPRLFEDDSLGLRGVARSLAWSATPARDAIDQLIRGPNGDERAADFHYALDRRTRLRSAMITDGTAIVDFETGLEHVHGRPFSELVYWSILYTATEVPGVERLALQEGGGRLSELGFPAFSVPAAAGRSDAPAWARPR